MAPRGKAELITNVDVAGFSERAELARKARKAAPAVDVRGFVTVPQKDIIKRLAEGEGGVDKKMHRIFVGRDQLAEYADKGYAPVVRSGDLVIYQSDVCVETTVGLHQQALRESVAMSNALLGERVKKDAQATKVSTGEQMTVQTVNADALGSAAPASDD